MSTQVASRLTCFAMISAIEADIRDHILSLAHDSMSEVLKGDAVEKAARRHLEATGRHHQSVLDLLEYCDFADLATALRQVQNSGLGVGVERDIAQAIESASPARNRVCHSRPLEPEDFPAVIDLVEKLTTGTDKIAMPHLREVRTRISIDPASVFSLEIPEFWQDRSTRPTHNLPVPEFDDTGFLGRRRDRDALMKLLMSAHPVITVVGEGGVGKTALAMRCLYDVVAQGDDCRFDAVVWVSLKTLALVPSGTREVRNAVVDVLGLLKVASRELGLPQRVETTVDALLPEILEYLAAFKVLLAIDNLETLTSGALRDLLVDLPPNSKVLLTSRVPLGEFEVRYALDRMDTATASLLARRYAAVLNVTTISNASTEQLDNYVDKLFGNPLLIKWFIGAASTGEDPNLLLSSRPGAFDDAIAFCFQNLFDRLQENERRVLHTIAAARKPLSRGELIMLVRRRATEIEEALATLNNSSMLRRITSRRGDSFALTPIAATFVERLRPPDSSLVQETALNLGYVQRMADAGLVARAGYEYDPWGFEWSTRDELIASSILVVAQGTERQQLYEDALMHVHHASRIAPNYSETYRIEARIRARMGDLFRATEAYERALALAPESHRLKYFYGMFLLADVHDFASALDQFNAIEAKDPKDAAAMTGAALALARLGRYEEAIQRYEAVAANLGDVPLKHRISIRDQYADCYRRWMERDAARKEPKLYVEHVSGAFAVCLNAAKIGEIDNRMEERFGAIADQACLHAVALFGDSVAACLVEAAEKWPAEDGVFARWANSSAQFAQFAYEFPVHVGRIAAAIPEIRIETDVQADAGLMGTISVRAVHFGFIEGDTGGRWYFSSRECRPVNWFSRATIGSRVRFELGSNAKGPCAIRVRPLRERAQPA